MKNYLEQRPWIWIVIAFAVLIAALASLVTTAVRNMPETAPLNWRPAHAGH